VVGSSHWDDKGFQAESACNVAGSETRAVVERHPVGTHSVETLTMGDRHVVDSRVHPLGRRILVLENEIMGERFPMESRGLVEQRPIENIMDNRLMGRRHPVNKVIPVPERYTIEAVGIGERNHSDTRSVGERQLLENKSVTEINSADHRGVAERYHVNSRVLRERHTVDSGSLIVEPRIVRDSYSVDARAMQHMDRERYNAEIASTREIFPIDPRYPVGIRHSIDAMALNQGHPVETRNMGERYPLESRVLVGRYTVDPRATGNRYAVETAVVGERVVWTEEANNVR
jgi:hypothetical protein